MFSVEILRLIPRI